MGPDRTLQRGRQHLRFPRIGGRELHDRSERARRRWLKPLGAL